MANIHERDQFMFYGTTEETYYLNRGELYCVQSPDLAATGGKPTRVDSLPEGAEPLSDAACADLEIPDNRGHDGPERKEE